MLEYVPLLSAAVDGGKSAYNRFKENGYEKRMQDYLDYEISAKERHRLKEESRILIPCYNSEEDLEEVIPEYGDWIENITLIDDGSDDETASKAHDLGVEDVISLDENSGKLTALNEGLKELSGDIKNVVHFDDDTYFDGDMTRALLFVDGGDEGELKEYVSAAMHVLPDIDEDDMNLTQAYQYFEYMISMEQKKGMYGEKDQVMNISGCAGLYDKDLFSDVLDTQLEESNYYEGEDYWRTQEILSRGHEVPLIPKEIGTGAKTIVPDNFFDLAKQRIDIWSPGRVKVDWDNKDEILEGDRRSGELAFDSVLNVAMEPLKVASLPYLATSPALPAFLGMYGGLTYYNYNRYFDEDDKDKIRKYLPAIPFYDLAMKGVRALGYLNGVKKALTDWRDSE